jgi:hypothetical protein
MALRKFFGTKPESQRKPKEESTKGIQQEQAEGAEKMQVSNGSKETELSLLRFVFSLLPLLAPVECLLFSRFLDELCSGSLEG